MRRIAVCLYVRNAENDIEEWIAYHSVTGANAFVIYDNGSTDRTAAKATAMGTVADVRVVPWGHKTGPRAQVEAYEDCLERFKGQFEWLLFLDSDEFLVSTDGRPMKSLLDGRFFDAAIAFNWACFGSNGHVNRPPGLMIEEFTARSDESFGPNEHTKVMVRPDLVKSCSNPHYFEMNGPMVRSDGRPVDWKAQGHTHTIDLSGWRVNHYFVRSREQWDAKLARGYRDIVREDVFPIYDRNEVSDTTAASHAGAVRALIAEAHARQTMGRKVRAWLSRTLGLSRAP